MRTGIYTFCDIPNYGAALQTFALQTVVERLGYECYVVRYYGGGNNNYKPEEKKAYIKKNANIAYWLYIVCLQRMPIVYELPPFYVTVLVGINKKTSKELPNSIIPIERTKNQEELAEIYTVADIYVNPTKEDTFSLVNIEALACGMPVITYKSGGAAESIVEGCGLVINSGEYADLKDGILGFDLMRKNSIEDLCINQAKNYDSKKIYKKYIEVYKEMIKDE